MKRLSAIIIVQLLLPVVLFSQNETKKWYFGAQAGLDFMGAPTILTNGMMSPWEGCASIADAAGSLLFYTDGISVWNKTHAVMANGTGLMGNSSSTQSGVIVKQPGSTTIYYIFTADAQGGANGLRYSIVDMSLSAGNGSVTVKNTLLYTPTTEKITAVRHCNGRDVWVVTHDWLSSNFRSYLVTAAGIGPAVLSNVGPIHNVNTGNTIGQMKASPNGRKLCLCMQYAPFDCFHLCDFDNSTGVVSNLINLGNTFVWPYGIEFSPDGTKLYGGKYGSSSYQLYQWNVCAGSAAAIIASCYTIATIPAMPMSIQAAANGKIYVCRYSQQINGVVNNPNVLGAGCNYVDLGQSTAPRTNNLGLPNFVTSYLKAPPVPYTYTTNPNISTCLTASFTAPPGPTVNCSSSNYSVTGYLWNFGDPPSGALNTSTATNPTHTYPSSGNYTASLIVNYTCGADTVQMSVVVNPCGPLPIELKKFDAKCTEEGVRLNWETTSEKNNDYFTIKKSTDAINFTEVEKIKGAGTSNKNQTYSIVDYKAEKEKTYYYRIFQTDFGKTERMVFDTREVNCSNNNLEIKIHPSPSDNSFFIKSNKDLFSPEVKVVDVLGNILLNVSPALIERDLPFEIKTEDLDSGCYYLRIINNGTAIIKKIVIAK